MKDYLITVGGFEKVEFNKKLLRSCSSAHSRYRFHLQEKKKEEELRKERVKQQNKRNSAKEQFEEMERDRKMILKGIEVVEKSLKEGHDDFEQILKPKSLNRDGLNIAQSKISMGIKRKSELATELARKSYFLKKLFLRRKKRIYNKVIIETDFYVSLLTFYFSLPCFLCFVCYEFYVRCFFIAFSLVPVCIGFVFICFY